MGGGTNTVERCVFDIKDTLYLRYEQRVFSGTPRRLRIGNVMYKAEKPIRRYKPVESSVHGMTQFDGTMLTIYRVDENTSHHEWQTSVQANSRSATIPESAQDILDLVSDASLSETPDTDVLQAHDRVVLKMRSVVWLGASTPKQREILAESVRRLQRDLRCALFYPREGNDRPCIGDAAVLRAQDVSSLRGVHATRGGDTVQNGTRSHQFFSMVLMPKYDHDLRQYLRHKAKNMDDAGMLRLMASVLRLLVRTDEQGWRCLDFKPTNIVVVRGNEELLDLRLIDHESIVPQDDTHGACTFPHPTVASEHAHESPFRSEVVLWTVAATVVYIVSHVIQYKGFPYHKLAHDFDGAARRACMTSFVALLRTCALRTPLFVTETAALLQILTDTECGLRNGDWACAMRLLDERAETLSEVADRIRHGDEPRDGATDASCRIFDRLWFFCARTDVRKSASSARTNLRDAC
ncbi:hypothetical protein CYMTET_3891 [Cymbomonas tetramitiformis]|uniref:Protein kinase domain-containing protein n=1 Tax=Cymbomonas tetramitiformis TaxID=36881 RepID=A0AAE0H2H4_9CHLO|nr:hypothetical protein CYMTET_3891 [Cymbomonas tetramitiformis]